MKTIMKLLATLGLAASLSGCVTTSIDKDYPYQDKVWRMVIYAPMVSYVEILPDTAPPSAEELALRARIGATAETVRGIRWAQVKFADAWFAGTIHWLKAAVPDSMDSKDVAKMAIVDVLIEKNSRFNYEKQQFNRIVRLVCKADDKACFKRIKDSGTLETVIVDNPPLGETFGQTYNYRLSKEGLAEYKKSLQ